MFFVCIHSRARAGVCRTAADFLALWCWPVRPMRRSLTCVSRRLRSSAHRMSQVPRWTSPDPSTMAASQPRTPPSHQMTILRLRTLQWRVSIVVCACLSCHGIPSHTIPLSFSRTWALSTVCSVSRRLRLPNPRLQDRSTSAVSVPHWLNLLSRRSHQITTSLSSQIQEFQMPMKAHPLLTALKRLSRGNSRGNTTRPVPSLEWSSSSACPWPTGWVTMCGWTRTWTTTVPQLQRPIPEFMPTTQTGTCKLCDTFRFGEL